MRKFIYSSMMIVAALMMTACNGNKQKAAADGVDSTENFEVQQIKKGMNMHLDSLTEAWLRLQPSPVYTQSKDGKIKLSADEKKVKPDYLFTPDKLADKLETMSGKYRAITVFFVDREIANLYDMKDDYTPAMKKLAAELNDPAIQFVYDNGEKMTYQELNEKAYAIEEENGRANRFWEAAATAIIEQTYILTQNQDKFLATFTDKDAEDITYRTSLLINAYEDLSEYDPDLLNIFNVIQPLEKLNAISVDQLRQQLNEVKDDVVKAREMLFQ